MALLTLVENAVRHGIDPSEDGGRIEVGARRDPTAIACRVQVIDTGVGIAGSTVDRHRPRQPARTPAARLRRRRASSQLTAVQPHGMRAETRPADAGADAP